jgi:hypothetical protein
MQEKNGSIKAYAGTFAVFYTLWAVVVLHRDKASDAGEFAPSFEGFMTKVKELESMTDEARAERLASAGGRAYKLPLEFLQATKGASTDLTPRAKRLAALAASLKLT